MRQAGILAAAGIVALTSQVSRLAEDHDNARLLAAGLAGIDDLDFDPATVQTNMVFLALPAETISSLTSFLRDRGILVTGRNGLRLVTHLNVTAADIERVVSVFKEFFRNR